MPTSYIYPSYILHPAIAAADDASTSKGALYILLSGETSVVAGRELCLFIYALRICALRICVFAPCASAPYSSTPCASAYLRAAHLRETPS